MYLLFANSEIFFFFNVELQAAFYMHCFELIVFYLDCFHCIQQCFKITVSKICFFVDQKKKKIILILIRKKSLLANNAWVICLIIWIIFSSLMSPLWLLLYITFFTWKNFFNNYRSLFSDIWKNKVYWFFFQVFFILFIIIRNIFFSLIYIYIFTS